MSVNLKPIIYSKGFTIVELLVVIVVIGVLAAITVVSYTGISQKATVASLISDLDNASKLLKMDQVINSAYPASLAVANSGEGIPSSPGTTYNYILNSSITPPGFCITATKGLTSYRITENDKPSIGNCDDYGIVLHLDAGNTASYTGTGNTWTDLSGLGNNGTLVGGPTYSIANGGVLSFEGLDDYINIIGNASLEPQNLTISVWMNMSTDAPIVRNIFLTKWNGYSCEVEATTRKPYFRLNGVGDVLSSDNLITGNWYNFVGTFEKGIGSKIYLNGVLKGSLSSSSAISYTANSVLNIGRWEGGVYIDAIIPDIHIFNRVLSYTEITQNFNNTKARYGL